MPAPHSKPARASATFLRRWAQEGPWVVTAIDPDEGYIRTRGFAPGDEEALRAFIAQWRGRRNLYFQVNRDLRAPADIMSKGRKEHIGSVMALHVDIDTYKGGVSRDDAIWSLTEELPEGIPGPPSALNDSGNGLQAFWLLRTPVEIGGDVKRAEAVEQYNRGLAVAFGGDMTTDVSRIMRLPWSINFPNETKRQLGLVPVMARQLSFDGSRRYDLEQFPAVRGSTSARLGGPVEIGEAITVDSVEELRIPKRTRTIILTGSYPGEQRKSRSEWVWAVILSMLRSGVELETILGVITDPSFAISESLLEKPDPEQDARRQIARARAWLEAQVAHDFDDTPSNMLTDEDFEAAPTKIGAARRGAQP